MLNRSGRFLQSLAGGAVAELVLDAAVERAGLAVEAAVRLPTGGALEGPVGVVPAEVGGCNHTIQ